MLYFSWKVGPMLIWPATVTVSRSNKLTPTFQENSDIYIHRSVLKKLPNFTKDNQEKRTSGVWFSAILVPCIAGILKVVLEGYFRCPDSQIWVNAIICMIWAGKYNILKVI